MRSVVFSLAMSIGVFLTGALPAAAQTAPGSARTAAADDRTPVLTPITGIVVDAESGTPLPGANLRLTWLGTAGDTTAGVTTAGDTTAGAAATGAAATGGAAQSGTGAPAVAEAPPKTALETGTATDPMGRFALLPPRPGRYTLTTTYVGFLAHTDTLVTTPSPNALHISLTPSPFEINPITISASRRPERLLESPSAVTVLEARQLEARSTLTIADHLSDVPSVDVIKTGLNQSRVVIRGFNDNLSSSLLTMVDDRITQAPAVRLTALQMIPSFSSDMERLEVVSGPASALYGPNAANGVVHLITKSPFDAPGTSLSLSGGQQSLKAVAVRHAAVLSEHWGYKVTAQYYSGQDFEYVSPAEQSARQQALDHGANPDSLLIGRRDSGVSNLGLTARVEGRLSGSSTLLLDAGLTRGDNIEITPTGAAQIRNAQLGYLQARLRHHDLFIQAYGNFLSSGSSYFLRTGERFIDRSRLWVVQAQHHRVLTKNTRLTYGLDWLHTVPRNEGTVSGGYEDDDIMDEPGVYLQSDTDLSSHIALTLAGRMDYHSRLDAAYLSPRAAIVYKPQNAHNFRLTYNRAYKSPASNELFGDVLGARDVFGLGGLGSAFGVSGRTDLRAQGMFTGFSFSRDARGLPQYRSPFADHPDRYIDLHDPAMTARMWDVARFATVSGLASNLAQNGLLSGDAVSAVSQALEAVLPMAVPGVLNALQVLDLESQRFVPLSSVEDLGPLDVTRTETVEIGYKGLIGRSLVLGVDAYWSRIHDFVSPFFVGTPNVFLDPTTLNRRLLDALPGVLASDPQAAADLARLDGLIGPANGSPVEEIAALVSTGVAGAIPFGTVSPLESFDPTAVVLMRRNIGDISLFGVDVAATKFLSRSLRVGGTYAWVSDDYFVGAGVRDGDGAGVRDEGGAGARDGAGAGRASGTGGAARLGTSDIALNAPRNKYGLHVEYLHGDWSGQLRVRGAQGFPVRSDVYVGSTEAFSVLDLAASYTLRRDTRLTLTVQNALDNRHRQFVDVAELGRVAVLRVEVGL